MLQNLINQYKANQISTRSLIARVKNKCSDELCAATSWMNSDADVLERLYCCIHDIQKIPVCKYCNKPAKWNGRYLKKGYLATCCNEKCISIEFSTNRYGRKVSTKRDEQFIEWQSSITSVDDNIVKQIRYVRHLALIDNPLLLDYLQNRFNDSDSITETYQRIKSGYFVKPVCPICGKPVKWIGKKSLPYTTYCSCKCAANSSTVKQRKQATLIRNWGNIGCYDSPIYREHLKNKIERETWATGETIQHRTDTLISKYGTTKLYSVPEIKAKIDVTNLVRYGHTAPLMNPDVKQRYYAAIAKNRKACTSKEEERLHEELLKAYPDIKRHYYSEKYPFNCDFYIPSLDVYIEYQGSAFHHGHPYNPTDIEDMKEVQRLMIRSHMLDRHPNMYDVIIRIWTENDPMKRQVAVRNRVKLLEVWPKYNINNIIKQINQL